ncbi:MAG: hypothetical protein IPI22_12580 [Bacteroidetes bacterium]|nr:hypothetical protein [Bacteroidota bacterium]
MSQTNQLQITNSYRNIIQLALPIAIAILIPQLNILTNTLFLGNYTLLNATFTTQDLLSATGIAGIYYLTLSMIGYGLSSGILMLMSRSAGSNDLGQIGKIFFKWACVEFVAEWCVDVCFMVFSTFSI